MRKASWMMLGISGFAASIASGSSLDFTLDTVLHSDADAFDVNSNSLGRLTGISQVVGYQNGQVAAIVQFGDVPSVIYKNTFGNSNTLLVAQQGSTFDSADPIQFNAADPFSQLVFAGGSAPHVSFIGKTEDDSPGVFQYTVGASTPGKKVLLQGDAYPTGGAAVDFETSSGQGEFPLQGNAGGGLLLGVKTVAGGEKQYLIRSSDDGSTLTTMIQEPAVPAGYVEFNTINGGTAKKVLVSAGGANQAAVFMAKADVAASVDIVRTNPPGIGATVVVAGGFLLPGDPTTTYFIDELLGANNQDALYRTSVTGGSTDSAIFVKHNASNIKLADYDSSDITTFQPTGQITPGGKAAFFVPGAAGTLQYFDTHSGLLAPSLVATEGEFLEDEGMTITNLSTPFNSNPMINERGEIVFEATLDNGIDQQLGLLVWKPGMSDPVVVLRTGDFVDINGESRAVEFIWPDFSGASGDIYKDGLDDRGRLSFGVHYINGDDETGYAILSVQVPEPGSLLSLLALTPLALKRRRRSISN